VNQSKYKFLFIAQWKVILLVGNSWSFNHFISAKFRHHSERRRFHGCHGRIHDRNSGPSRTTSLSEN